MGSYTNKGLYLCAWGPLFKPRHNTDYPDDIVVIFLSASLPTAGPVLQLDDSSFHILYSLFITPIIV